MPSSNQPLSNDPTHKDGQQSWGSTFVEDTTQVQRRRARYVRQACDECRRRKLKEHNTRGRKRRAFCFDRRSATGAGGIQGTPNPNGVESLSSLLSSTNSDTALAEFEDAEYAWPTEPCQKDTRQDDIYAETYHSSRSILSPGPSSVGISSASAVSSTPATEQEDQVTDTFDVSIDSSNGKLSMQSKLSAAHNALGMEPFCNSDTSLAQRICSFPADAVNNQVQSSSYPTLQLPEPPRLANLLQVFWAQHNPFFPCINRDQFQQDLSRWLLAGGYSLKKTVVQVTPTFAPLALNLCIVLAVAEFVDPKRGSRMSGLTVEQSVPGKLWHDRSLAIINRVFPAHDQEVEIVRFYVLEAMYLIYTEQLRQASKAIAVAVQLAIRAELHDQSAWSDLTPTVADSRRVLFWCLYYLDRRISEKCGEPYRLRNEEVYVAEIVTPIVHGPLFPINGDGESVAFNTAMRHYVQHLIDWAHLWADIWDTLFSLRVRRLAGDMSCQVKSVNGRIERMLANLPPELQWPPKCLRSGTGVEDERQARLSLLAFSRLVMVQLLLHHNPLGRFRSNTAGSFTFCLNKATEVVEAIILHMETFDTYNQLGQWACAVLAECIYHLVPFVATENDQTSRSKAISSLLSIKSLMENMTLTQGSARRALGALRRIFSAVESRDSSPRNIDIHSSMQRRPSASISGIAANSSSQASHDTNVSKSPPGGGSARTSTSPNLTHFSAIDFLSQLDIRSDNREDALDMLLWPSPFEIFDQVNQIPGPFSQI